MTTSTLDYTTLRPGDTYQKGDEYRTAGYDIGATIGLTYSQFSRRHKSPPGDWCPVAPGLYGQPILASDLMHRELRRPV